MVNMYTGVNLRCLLRQIPGCYNGINRRWCDRYLGQDHELCIITDNFTKSGNTENNWLSSTNQLTLVNWLLFDNWLFKWPTIERESQGWWCASVHLPQPSHDLSYTLQLPSFHTYRIWILIFVGQYHTVMVQNNASVFFRHTSAVIWQFQAFLSHLVYLFYWCI